MFSLTNEIFDELGIKEQTHSFCSAETTAETRLVNLVISSPHTLKKKKSSWWNNWNGTNCFFNRNIQTEKDIDSCFIFFFKFCLFCFFFFDSCLRTERHSIRFLYLSTKLMATELLITRQKKIPITSIRRPIQSIW